MSICIPGARELVAERETLGQRFRQLKRLYRKCPEATEKCKSVSGQINYALWLPWLSHIASPCLNFRICER